MNKAETAASETEKARAKEQVEMFFSKKVADYYEAYYSDKTGNNSNFLDWISSQTDCNFNEGFPVGDYWLQRITTTGAVEKSMKVATLEEMYATAENEKLVGVYKGNSNAGTLIWKLKIKQDGKLEWDAQDVNAAAGGTSGSSSGSTTPATPTKYTVSYNANGGRGDVPANQTGEANEEITIDSTTQPTRNGYFFQGWNTANDATTTISTVTIENENITLYAVWEKANQQQNSQHPEWHIPTGFQYLTGTVDTGYVITDSTAENKSGGNEFVWIPVASEEAYVKKAGANNYHMTAQNVDDAGKSIADMVAGDVLGVNSILGTNVTSTLSNNQPEKSVVCNAGGFWVGRYEAGITSTARSGNLIDGITDIWFSDSNKATTINTFWDGKTIIVSQNAEPVRLITQSKALEKANNWKSGNADETAGTVKFQSGLITGTQWDVMCEYIGWSTCNSDCSSWGNYYNAASGSYSGIRSSDSNTTWKSELGQKNANTYSIFPTGVFSGPTVASTAKKNIYDVAGNVWEWTTEQPVNASATSDPHAVIRGGGAVNNGSERLATYRNGSNSATVNGNWGVGARLVLYVQ